jgi:type II restriction/modification system DNA methylase subunit YeeA
VKPWEERIEAAGTIRELLALHQELLAYKVLDPASGSGNFLYIAYRELKRIEMDLLERICAQGGERARAAISGTPMVSTKQFYGIDNNPFAIELAKVTLMLAKEIAVAETQSLIDVGQMDFPLDFDRALPLDNLDTNIICDDALFCDWPQASAIIGNPLTSRRTKYNGSMAAPMSIRCVLVIRCPRSRRLLRLLVPARAR